MLQNIAWNTADAHSTQEILENGGGDKWWENDISWDDIWFFLNCVLKTTFPRIHQGFIFVDQRFLFVK
jgi:hypothetical protein